MSKSGAWAPKPIAWVVSSSFGEQLSPAGSLPPASAVAGAAAAAAAAAPADAAVAPADAAHKPPSGAASDDGGTAAPPPSPPSPAPVPVRRSPRAAAGQAARNRLAFDIAPSVTDASALAADVAAALAANGVKVRVTVNAGPDGRPQVVCSPAAASVADAVTFVQKMLGVERCRTLVYGRKPFVVDAVGGKTKEGEPPVALAVVDGEEGGGLNEVRALPPLMIAFLALAALFLLSLGRWAGRGVPICAADCLSHQDSPGLPSCLFDLTGFFMLARLLTHLVVSFSACVGLFLSHVALIGVFLLLRDYRQRKASTAPQRRGRLQSLMGFFTMRCSETRMVRAQ